MDEMEPEPVDEKNMPATEEATAELFDDIDASYFLAEGFDPTAYELNKMKHMLEFDMEFLERECFRLKRQAQVVSKKVSALILQNSLGFGSQVKHYSSVQHDAHEILQAILDIRRVLATCRRDCRTALAVVANHRKRRYLEYLKSTLRIIKSLVETQAYLKQLICSGDFAGAINICVDAIRKTERYKHFVCIREVSRSLTKQLASIEDHIDDALAAQTVKFDAERYALLQSAYEMLANTEKAAQRFQRFFRATIESSTRSILVAKFKSSGSDLRPDSMSYEELCQATPVDAIPTTGRALLCAVHDVLCLYHTVLRFHVDDDERRLFRPNSPVAVASASNNCSVKKNTSEPTLSYSSTSRSASFSAAAAVVNDLNDAHLIVEKGVFQKSLIDNLYSIFKCAALKYNTLLCCCDLAALKFDEFIAVVEMSNRFRKFGRKHFGNHCVEVALTLEKQSCLYFQRYHAERMDELKMFLESEAFALCPVSVQFTLFDLPEFYFLKESSDSFDDELLSRSDSTRLGQLVTEHLEIGEQLDFALIQNARSTSFFAMPPNDAQDVSATATNADALQPNPENGIHVVRSPNLQKSNSVMTDNSSFMDRSSSEDSVYDENRGDSLQDLLPNLCNTALNVLRFFGRYIRMNSTLLQSISEPAILSIIQLYKYFFYSIYKFFCVDFCEIPTTELDFCTSRLRNLVFAIRDELIQKPRQKAADGSDVVATNENHLGDALKPLLLVEEARRAETIDVDDARRIYALAERIVGVESIIFLAKQLELLRPVLVSLTKKRSKALDEFYKSVLPVTVDLRRCAYGAVASRVFDYGSLIKRVTSVKWDVQDIQSQHNAYVDFILNECLLFKERLGDASNVSHISSELSAQIWSYLCECIFRALVQGNSEASKKCSNEGRALMLLDFESLSGSLETLTALRPLPQKSYLENYIKAFYLPQDDLGEWIIHHTEYTVGQVTALLNASSGATKKSKFSFMNILDGRDLIS